VQVKNADGFIEVGEDVDPSLVYGGPLAVLVNRFSASASEIFAAAIQELMVKVPSKTLLT
jgi:carboxyl-terminal processing protease